MQISSLYIQLLNLRESGTGTFLAGSEDLIKLLSLSIKDKRAQEFAAVYFGAWASELQSLK